jgi:hypothetical protein
MSIQLSSSVAVKNCLTYAWITCLYFYKPFFDIV